MEEINNQKITKREMRLLKRQRERQGFLRSIRYRKIKKLSILLILILLVGTGIFGLINYFSGKSQGNSGSGAPIAAINPPEHDFGDVNMSAGLLKKIFEIKNIGNGDLKIDNIWTSCHCTTAVLRVGDKISPKFGMGPSLSFRSEKIAPNETGYLEVVFDPAYHGSGGIGPTIRAVYLDINDSQNEKLEVRIIANVLP